jgi:hypothetical protein
MLTQGKSLTPLLNQQGKINEFVFVETQLSRKLPRFTALRGENYKYIEIQRGQFTFREWITHRGKLWRIASYVSRPKLLFSLREDPAEKVNIARTEKGLVKKFGSLAQTIVMNNTRIRSELRREKKVPGVDDAVAKQLQALGYFE